MTQQPDLSKPAEVAPVVNRFESIDGLRAVACIGVILHHGFVHAGRYSFPSIPLPGTHLSLSRGLSYGYLGVEIFFVLSAFCLAYPLLVKDRPFAWGDYLYRRAIRILPPYFVTYILLVLIGLAIRLFHAEPFYSGGFLQANLTDTIYGFLLRYGAYNGSFWTLCIEARWYFVLPVLLLLLRRWGWPVLFVTCFLIATLHTYFSIHHTFAGSKIGNLLFESVLLLPAYLPTFALGILVARITVSAPSWTSDPRCIWLVRLLLVSTCICLPFFVPVVPIAGESTGRIIFGSLIAFSLLLLSIYDPVVRRLLSRPLLVQLGIASYSIYLIHEPIIHALYFVTAPWHLPESAQFLIYEIVVPLLLLAIGYGFYLLVEHPLLEWQKRARRRVITR